MSFLFELLDSSFRTLRINTTFGQCWGRQKTSIRSRAIVTNSRPDARTAINQLIESFQDFDDEKQEERCSRLEWLSYSEFTDMELIQNSADQTIYYATHEPRQESVMLLLLGKCTQEFIHEFSRIYSLPTYKYKNAYKFDQFERYPEWLTCRNNMIIGFTCDDKNNYFLIAKKPFHYCYSRYGFCSACGILRCSPVWCICGHKELAYGWTSYKKNVDELIRGFQGRQKTTNKVRYLEWIPFDCIKIIESNDKTYAELYGLPTYERVELVPFELTDEMNYSDYHKVSYGYQLLLLH